MSDAYDFYGSVFERGSAVLLARVTLADGAAIQQSDVVSIAYTVSELSPCTGEYSAVAGHDGVGLVASDTVYDALQTGEPWDVDETGYNFRHEVDVSSEEAFPTAGATYQVRYELQPTTGQKMVFRFQLRAI